MRRPSLSPAVITVLLSAVAVAGYLAYRATGDSPGAKTPPTTTAAVQRQSDPQALVDTLPEFSLQNMAGTRQSIQSFLGEPMLINFWATWCGPCRREIPMLKKVQKKNPSIRIVGIAVDDRQAVLEYAQKMQFNYPVLMGTAGAMKAANSFGIDFYALPFSVFVDASGHVLGVHTGELQAEQVDKVLTVFSQLGHNNIDIAKARQRIAKI